MNHLLISKACESNASSCTSFSDIGKEMSGEILTRDRYLQMENQYLEVVDNYLDKSGCEAKDFKIVGLEDNRGTVNEEGVFFSLENPKIKLCAGESVLKAEFFLLIRLSLRDLLWTRFETEDGCYITFGQDMHMYIGFPDEMEIACADLSIGELRAVEREEDPHG